MEFADWLWGPARAKREAGRGNKLIGSEGPRGRREAGRVNKKGEGRNAIMASSIISISQAVTEGQKSN